MVQTQNLILRVVAQREEISSGELVDIVQRFGRSSDAVRSAVNRMVRAGLLTKAGRGRGKLQYKMGSRGQAVVEQFIAKVLRWHVALVGQSTWDGNWLVVTFSIPEGQRAKRDAFRTRLAEMGFGLLSSSVWISPFDQETEVTAWVEELGLSGLVTLLRCRQAWMPGAGSSGELAYRVWELGALETRYRDFNGRAEMLLALLKGLGQGEKVDAEALFFEAMELQGELIDVILVDDPCLPRELLPPEWSGRRTHELLHTLTHTVDQLEAVAHRYDFLFHLIRGMDVLAGFLPEDDSFHWPSERCEGP